MKYARRARRWLTIPGLGADSAYLFNDTFTTDLAGGAVNGTAAEPGPGQRVVVDTNSKLSLSSGATSFATAGAAAADPGLWYGAVDRVAGRGLVAQITHTTSGGYLGWDSNQAGLPVNSILLSGTTVSVRTSGNIAVGAVTTSTSYQCAVVLRTTGAQYFIKGGVFTNWTLLYVGDSSSVATMYPGIQTVNASSVFTNEYIRVPSALWLGAPVASDDFSAWGTSDGLGHAEGIAGGLGVGGSGRSWTQQLGTWTASSGVANASVLSGGLACATVDTATADVLTTVEVTRAAGDAGVVVRYSDSSNYVYALHNGTNAQLIKVVAGTPTTLVNAAATYVAGAELRVICEGTKFRLYYNNVFIGTEQTVADAGLQSGTKQGLYTTDTGNTFDGFTVYSRGSGSEYAALDAF